jgi:hypothetical protein
LIELPGNVLQPHNGKECLSLAICHDSIAQVEIGTNAWVAIP